MIRRFRTLSTGHAYPEGPCIGPDGELYIVELAAGVIARVEDGERVVIARTPGAPNGAALTPTGDVVFCNNGGNWGPNASTGHQPGLGGATPRIQRLTRDGSVDDILVAIDSIPLNGPNDLVLDAGGNVWFTDPAWAARDESGAAPASASPPGALRWMSADGTHARTIADGLIFPNGLAFAPDGSLIVGETGTGLLYRYSIDGEGSVGDRAVYTDLGADSYPDGMCFDSEGSLIVAGTGSGRLYVVASDGRVRESIVMEDHDVTNVCFGGIDGTTLIVTEASLGRVSATQWHCAGQPLIGSPAPWVR